MPFFTCFFLVAHRQFSFLELSCSQLPSGLSVASAHSVSPSEPVLGRNYRRTEKAFLAALSLRIAGFCEIILFHQ